MKLSTSARFRLHLVGVALLAISASTHGAESPPVYTDLLLEDIQEVVTAPAHWQADDWKNLGWTSLVIVGTAAFVDAPLRDEMRRYQL